MPPTIAVGQALIASSLNLEDAMLIDKEHAIQVLWQLNIFWQSQDQSVRARTQVAELRVAQ
jgi:hypothetical protein